MYCYHPWLDENDAKNVLFCSVHLFCDEKGNEFFPGTGNVIGIKILL